MLQNTRVLRVIQQQFEPKWSKKSRVLRKRTEACEICGKAAT